MFRKIAIIAVTGFAALATLNAGQIQIGGNTGLTTTYGVTGTGGATQTSYALSAFQGAGSTVAGTTAAGVLCAGATAATCTSQPGTAIPSGEPNNEFAISNGVTFALIDQTVSGTNEGVWAAANSGTTTSVITIPMGIFGVTNVYTMLNDEYGVNGAHPTTVEFDFANSADNLIFTLYNGTVIRDDFNCTGGSGLTSCTNANFAQGVAALNITNAYGTNGSSLGLIGSTSSPNVSAFNVWTGTYGQGTGAYLNTTGTLFLDAQNFSLGAAAANDTLTQIVITDTTATKISRDLLSAVTVQTAPSTTPEPSTIIMMLTGLGAAGILRRRRKI